MGTEIKVLRRGIMATWWGASVTAAGSISGNVEGLWLVFLAIGIVATFVGVLVTALSLLDS